MKYHDELRDEGEEYNKHKWELVVLLQDIIKILSDIREKGKL